MPRPRLGAAPNVTYVVRADQIREPLTDAARTEAPEGPESIGEPDETVGLGETEGATDGSTLGATDGSAGGSGLGSTDGSTVGAAVGAAVGSGVGAAVGSGVGAGVGSGVGAGVGSAVGAGVALGDGLGFTAATGPAMITDATSSSVWETTSSRMVGLIPRLVGLDNGLSSRVTARCVRVVRASVARGDRRGLTGPLRRSR